MKLHLRDVSNNLISPIYLPEIPRVGELIRMPYVNVDNTGCLYEVVSVTHNASIYETDIDTGIVAIIFVRKIAS